MPTHRVRCRFSIGVRAGRVGSIVATLLAMAGSPAGVRPASAQVVTDGSLGAVRSLAGPNFQITSDLGKIAGGNLFHSLKTLNLKQGESATFSGPSSIRNVLTRVTGGTSSIDGTLSCTIPGANFYLMNPAGVVFGPDATLDVSGSFVVTTADQIKLADGAVFGMPGTADAALTTAAPAAFGFLKDNPAAIAVNQASLGVADGKVLSLVGGKLMLVAATLTAPEGRVNLVAAETGEVKLDPQSLTTPVDTTAVTKRGQIDVPTQGIAASSVSVDGDAAGRIDIIGSDISFEEMDLSADTTSAQSGGIHIDASGTLTFQEGYLSARTAGAGNGGDITVNAASAIFGNTDYALSFMTDVEAYIDPSITPGRAGNISITAGRVEADSEGASFSATDLVDGNNGTVTVTAPVIVRDGNDGRLVFDSPGAYHIGTAGKIITDGTTGPVVTLTGDTYTVDASLGRQSGGNLFLSFTRFDVGEGESATITGPSTVKRVIARVTGPAATYLLGPVTVGIDDADLLLINRQGILLGAGFALNTTGAFTVTTADSVRFADNTSFNDAATPLTLTSSAPAAFDFAAGNPGFTSTTAAVGGITLDGFDVTLAAGKSFDVIGGPISFQNTQIHVPQGAIRVIAAASTGEVLVTDGDPTAMAGLSQISQRGSIDMSSSSNDPSLAGILEAASGLVQVVGGKVTEFSTILSADSVAGGSAGHIALDFNDDSQITLATVTTAGDGPAGSIDVHATSLYMSQNTFDVSSTTSDAGRITLTATALTLSEGTFNADAAPPYTPGQISLTAPTISVTLVGYVPTTTLSAQATGGVSVSPGGRARLSVTGTVSPYVGGVSQFIATDEGFGTFYPGKGTVALDGTLGPGGRSVAPSIRFPTPTAGAPATTSFKVSPPWR